jgi:hypothetical protein
MSRSRAQGPFTAVYIYKYQDEPEQISSYNTFTDYMTESAVPGPCNVNHIKHARPYITTAKTSDWDLYWCQLGPIPVLPEPRIFWHKLPTSSEFSAIQFFAELDDTIAIFTRKFWKQLSYGSANWGLVPFVNDVIAFLEVLKSFTIDTSNFDYKNRYFMHDRPFVVENANDRFEGTFQGMFHLSGQGNIHVSNDAAIWLDRLGVHPDISTFWDLVPLSFVIDWLLPVGAFLDSIVGPGWVRNVHFKGNYSVKWSVEGTHISKIFPSESKQTYKVHGYRRTGIDQLVIIPGMQELGLDMAYISHPSWVEAFSMAYIAGVFKNVPRPKAAMELVNKLAYRSKRIKNNKLSNLTIFDVLGDMIPDFGLKGKTFNFSRHL